MYARLLPFSTGPLRDTTTDHTYDNIYNLLDKEKKTRTAELVQLSEVIQFHELHAKTAIQKGLDCLVEVEKKLQQLIQGVQKCHNEYYPYTDRDLTAVDKACSRLKTDLEQFHSSFKSGILETAARNFQQEVEGLGKSLQQRIDNSRRDLRKTIEEARETFKKVKAEVGLDIRAAVSSVDSRLQHVCSNFDATEALSRDLLLKGIESAKEEYERVVLQNLEKFEWSTSQVVQYFCDEIDFIVASSSSSQQQEQEEPFDFEKILIHEPLVNDRSTLENIVKSINAVLQQVEELKGKTPSILSDLTDMNDRWMATLNDHVNPEVVARALMPLLAFIFIIIVLAMMAPRRQY